MILARTVKAILRSPGDSFNFGPSDRGLLEKGGGLIHKSNDKDMNESCLLLLHHILQIQHITS